MRGICPKRGTAGAAVRHNRSERASEQRGRSLAEGCVLGGTERSIRCVQVSSGRGARLLHHRRQSCHVSVTCHCQLQEHTQHISVQSKSRSGSGSDRASRSTIAAKRAPTTSQGSFTGVISYFSCSRERHAQHRAPVRGWNTLSRWPRDGGTVLRSSPTRRRCVLRRTPVLIESQRALPRSEHEN